MLIVIWKRYSPNYTIRLLVAAVMLDEEFVVNMHDAPAGEMWGKQAAGLEK